MKLDEPRDIDQYPQSVSLVCGDSFELWDLEIEHQVCPQCYHLSSHSAFSQIAKLISTNVLFSVVLLKLFKWEVS